MPKKYLVYIFSLVIFVYFSTTWRMTRLALLLVSSRRRPGNRLCPRARSAPRGASQQLFVCAEASFGVQYAWPIRPPCDARALPRGCARALLRGAPWPYRRGAGPFHMEKPGTIWHLDVDGCCRIHPDKEIVCKRGCPPHFPFEPFLERQKAYDSGAEKHVWESLEDLEHAVAREGRTTMLGHIAAETAKKWLGWELGELYAMEYREKVVFCIYGRTVVV